MQHTKTLETSKNTPACYQVDFFASVVHKYLQIEAFIDPHFIVHTYHMMPENAGNHVTACLCVFLCLLAKFLMNRWRVFNHTHRM